MFCMPPCLACKTAGACPQGAAPAVVVPARVPRTRRRRATQHAAIEAGLTGYFTLTCGKVTHRQEQEAFRAWAPKRGAYWCDECGHWNKKTPDPQPVTLPDEPMF